MSRKQINQKIKNNDESLVKDVYKYLVIHSGIIIFILYLFLAGAFLLSNEVSKLSFISPKIFFSVTLVFIVIVGILFSITLINRCILNRYFSVNTSKKLFDLVDIFSFIFVSLTAIVFVLMFILTPTVVDGSSMENTYHNGDRLLVWHLGYNVKDNDVVIIDINENYNHFKNNYEDETFYIKRVVATSGDSVRLEDTKFYVNDKLIDSSITETQFNIMTSFKSTSILKDGKIESGYSIVLGDNRYHSQDSRAIGAICNDDIAGKVIFRFYMKNAIGNPKPSINTTR